MGLIKQISDAFLNFDPEEKEGFLRYIPKKVYYTERNISIVVALIQLCMIVVFLVNRRLSIHNMRSVGYFSLYVFLLVITIIAIISYRYTVRKHHYKLFFWLRRIYAFFLVCWVMGITYLEMSGGHGLSSYYYLIPTTAALLLLNPIESFVIFTGAWCCLCAIMFILGISSGSQFGNLMNSVFVTVLALFISYRYYRSTATEYRDLKLIESQYTEIQSKNALLLQTVQIDQMTGIYNRHYLTEIIYPNFIESQQNNDYGMFVMLDIDFFKQYNDLYGHLQGDECLKSISLILNEKCDEIGASAIRYGGEEFLVIKMNHEPFDVYEFVNTVENEMKEALLYRSDIPPYYVTISMGVWCGYVSQVVSIENTIKYADESLYEAKSNGRKCSVFSSISEIIDC